MVKQEPGYRREYTPHLSLKTRRSCTPATPLATRSADLLSQVQNVNPLPSLTASVSTTEPAGVPEWQAQVEVVLLKEEVNLLRTEMVHLRNEVTRLSDSQGTSGTPARSSLAHQLSTNEQEAVSWTGASSARSAPENFQLNDSSGDASATIRILELKGDNGSLQHSISAIGIASPIPQKAPFAAAADSVVAQPGPEEELYTPFAEILHCGSSKRHSQMSHEMLARYMSLYGQDSFGGARELKAYCEKAKKVCDIELKSQPRRRQPNAFTVKLKDRMKPFKSPSNNEIFLKRDFSTLRALIKKDNMRMSALNFMRGRAKRAAKGLNSKSKLAASTPQHKPDQVIQ